MILLLCLVLAVANAEIINLNPGDIYQVGNRLPYTDADQISMDFKLTALNGNKFDVVFALVSCFYGYQYVETHLNLPESKYDVVSYQNNNTYTLSSYCYIIRNNAPHNAQFAYAFNINHHTIYPEISGTNKPNWNLILMICTIVAASLAGVTYIYYLVKDRCKPEKRENSVEMSENLEVLISAANVE